MTQVINHDLGYKIVHDLGYDFDLGYKNRSDFFYYLSSFRYLRVLCIEELPTQVTDLKPGL